MQRGLRFLPLDKNPKMPVFFQFDLREVYTLFDTVGRAMFDI